MSRVSVTIRIEEQLRSAARDQARADGRTVTSVVEDALAAYASGAPRPVTTLATRLAALDAELAGGPVTRRVLMTVRLPAGLLERGWARCDQEGVTHSEVIREALAEYIVGEPAQIATRIASRLEEAVA